MSKTAIKKITSREFYRNPAYVAQLIESGTQIIVTKNGEDFFKVVPKTKNKKRALKMSDFKDLIITSSKDKSLSKNIDKIVYGTK